MEKIVIPDKGNIKKKIKKIKQDGVDKFFVLSDFDGTLTKIFYNETRRPSLISLLRDENYLGKDYSQKAKLLYQKYHPIEIDPKIPLKTKSKKMEEWWRVHYELLKQFGFGKTHVRKIINSGKIKLREGIGRFFYTLKIKSIPLVIFSSSSLGIDTILMFLKKERKLFDNVFVVSNILQWDRSGKFVGIKNPLIHSLNKEGKILKKFPDVFKKIKHRNNVLLLGNDIGDILVLKGLKIKNSIKVGFLNEKAEELLEDYKKHFDFLILNDGTMRGVNELLEIILN